MPSAEAEVTMSPTILELLLPPLVCLAFICAGLIMWTMRHRYTTKGKTTHASTFHIHGARLPNPDIKTTTTHPDCQHTHNKIRPWRDDLKTETFPTKDKKKETAIFTLCPKPWLKDSESLGGKETFYVPPLFQVEDVRLTDHLYGRGSINVRELAYILLPVVFILGFCPLTLLLHKPLVMCLWPPDVFPSPPNINDAIACFLVPAGMVYAISFGFAFQQVAGGFKETEVGVTQQAAQLTKLLNLVKNLTVIPPATRIAMVRVIKDMTLTSLSRLLVQNDTSLCDDSKAVEDLLRLLYTCKVKADGNVKDVDLWQKSLYQRVEKLLTADDFLSVTFSKTRIHFLELNYARYLPAYYAQMTNLAASQPEIYKAFKDGNFSVQLTESNPFGRIPVDQTTEVTVNRDTQTVGGTTKFSLKPGAVSKYYLTAEYRSAFLTKLRNMVQHNRRGTDHPDLQKSRLQKDRELVTSVKETLANWANPFKCNTDLMNIASSTIASKEIAEDLKNAHTKGETDYVTFKRERLESDEPAKKFHDPMKKASLKTFGSAAKKQKTKYSDGRAKFDGQQPTFDEIAERIFSMAIREASLSTRLDIVFDTYKPLSIKYNERANRATTGLQVQIVAPGQKIKQWHKFLALESNNVSLIRFLVQEWRNEKYLEKLGHLHKVLFVTCEEQCFRFSAVRCREVPELQCVQEEADGRLLLHASHAAEAGYEAVMISSNDTDILVLNIALCGAIKAPLYQRSETSTRTQLIDIGKVASSLGPSVCTALLGLHAYTGCDSVSSFAGKGKVAALKMLKSNENVQQAFSGLGKDWELSGELFEKLEQFTCKLYAPKQPTTGVNELRYQLFCAKNGDIESHQLPPCQDCLWKYAQRANYQAGLWRHCLENDPQAPDPVGSGWTVERADGKDILAIDWMNVQPAPDAVLELLACSCRKEYTAATLADENDDDDDDEDDI
ncbi:hypothetical protein ACOMHN_000901 [Nucella lapillus]